MTATLVETLLAFGLLGACIGGWTTMLRQERFEKAVKGELTALRKRVEELESEKVY